MAAHMASLSALMAEQSQFTAADAAVHLNLGEARAAEILRKLAKSGHLIAYQPHHMAHKVYAPRTSNLLRIPWRSHTNAQLGITPQNPWAWR